MINAARKAWLDTLTLADRLAYDKAFGEFWFAKGPWPAAAHQYAKDLLRRNSRKGHQCHSRNAATTATPDTPTPGQLPTLNDR